MLAWQRVTAATITLGICLMGVLAASPAATAAPYGNVYLVVNNSRCVGGGSVVQITGAVDNVWSGGDAGDNIIYPRVDLGRVNTFNGRALCSRSALKGGSYWINVVYWQFRPTRSGQTFWY